MDWWRYPLNAILWVWTLPIGLGWLLNRRGARIGTMIDLDTGAEIPIHEVRWWIGGFSTAFWPGVLLSAKRASQLRDALETHGVATRHTPGVPMELVLHERRHVAQQALLGPLFLLAYGLAFLVLWPISGGWYAAYRAIPFERDARAWAAKRLAKGGVIIRPG